MSKRKRGRESAGDMVRSLGLVLLVVIPVWYLAQAPGSDKVAVREVDPRSAIQAFAADVPQAPVPGRLPDGWRATSATYTGSPTALRVGWVTPREQYAEYSASTGPREEFLRSTLGEKAQQLDDLTVDGQLWQRYREPDGSLSLTRSYDAATVVVGTRRATADEAELAVLLRALTRG